MNIHIEILEIFGKAGDWHVNFTLDGKEIKKDTYVEKLD